MSRTGHSAATRTWHALMRRYRSAWNRLRYRGFSFGRGCDIRGGFHGVVARGGRASFGPGCVIDRGMSVEVSGVLEVGARVIFGHHVTLGSADLVTIGEDCMIGELVSIRDHDHAFSDRSRPVRTQGSAASAVTIGRDVWIGGKATVLRGVDIAEGAVVGANAVVTKDVPAWAIVAGVPARRIGTRGNGDIEIAQL